jgi:hypothetical protein
MRNGLDRLLEIVDRLPKVGGLVQCPLVLQGLPGRQGIRVGQQ